MKTTLMIFALCIFTINVKAQISGGNMKMPSTLIMPDGSVVPSKSTDSIKKVFGGRDIVYSLLDDGTLHAHPANNKKEEFDSEAKLTSHLNKLAPEFAYRDLNGKLYSLSALKGKVVVLNFWFTQCGACRLEMPSLNELTKNYKLKDVIFLAVTYDDKAKVKQFLSEYKFDYTIIPEAHKMCLDYDIPDYPVSIVIDKNNVMKYVNNSTGSDIKKDLSKAIDNALN